MRGLPSRFRFLLISIFALLFGFDGITQVLTVSDQNGTLLPGVEVFTDDLKFAGVTDERGSIRLEEITDDDLLNFRFLGFEEISLTLKELKDAGFSVRLATKESLIDEVVILGRKEVSQNDVPFQIKSISYKEIASTNPQTSVDALAQHGGVFVQKSQMGGGSPVIRGFEANRVLLVVDGIRLNNAIYRNGHLQNAITVDQAMIERMEVVFGPNSLIYGSDALGGVVNFKTKSPMLSGESNKWKTSSGYYLRHSTANNEKSAHIDFSIGSNKWGSLTSLTYSDFGDLRTGANRDDRFPDFGKRQFVQGTAADGTDFVIENVDPNIQIGTGYEQFDILQKFLFVPNNQFRLSANIQFSTSSNVPRYDNLIEERNGVLRWAEWYYGPQTRALAALDFRHLETTSLYDQLVIIGAWQRIDEDRISRRFSNPLRNTQNEDVNVYSLTIDASKLLGGKEKWELEYGVDAQINRVRSTSRDFNISTGEVNLNALTRYASNGNDLNNYGAYLHFKGDILDDKLRLNGGLRWAHSSSDVSYLRTDPVEWPEEFYSGIRGKNKALTWSIGLNWLIDEKWQVRAISSTAFRSPNIDDLSKVRVNSDEITFPNLDLSPERSFSSEISVGFSPSERSSLSVTGFYTRLNNAIIRRPFLAPDGGAFWLTQGDTLQVVANQNVQKGEVYGISVNLNSHISDALTLDASINLTQGKELNDDGLRLPLTHIPPTYGNIDLSYRAGQVGTRLAYRFNAFKAIEDFGGSADNPDLATPVGSLSWSTFNLYSDVDLSDKINLSIGVENIFDRHYRVFSSGVSAPGRHFIFTFRGSL